MANTQSLLKIGLVANIFEWYEFFIYAYLADILGAIFFHANDAVSGLIKAFAVFAVGYFARPLGSLFFGILGDRIGRGYPLKITLLMMATPTALIGLLPVYADIGILAPSLLLVLRLIQGFAMGAEWPLNACYLFEAAPPAKRCALCGAATASVTLGMLSASLIVFLLFQFFARETLLAWAWRVPFLLSIPLTLAIRAMRRSIQPMPMPTPPPHAWRALTAPLLKTMPLVAFSTLLFHILALWLPAYLIHALHYPAPRAHALTLCFLTALLGAQLAAGYLIIFFTLPRLITLSLITSCLLAALLFRLLPRAAPPTLYALLILLACIMGATDGILMHALALQFPRFVRCRGMNLAYTLAIVAFGSSAPLLCTWAIQRTGQLLFPAFYICACAMVALPAALRLHSRTVEQSP